MTPDEMTNTDLRIEVAEMKGMLGQALSDQGNRINSHTENINDIFSKINTLGGLASEHSVKIASNEKGLVDARVHHDKDIVAIRSEFEKDIGEIKANMSGSIAKVFIVIGPILAGIAILIGVLRDVYIP